MKNEKDRLQELKSQSTQPSSSTAGFFQERPQIPNQFIEDAGLQRVLQLYIPETVQKSISPDLSRFGDVVLSREVLNWVADSEKNYPYLKTWDTFGHRQDELITSEGWRHLQALGIKEGIVAIPYENKEKAYSRLHQFLKYHIWTGSAAYVTCPSAMTDGAAYLLSKHLVSGGLDGNLHSVLKPAFQRLISRDPSSAWTSGQWMTERSGGSDVSGTETIAVVANEAHPGTSIDGSPLGPHSISGFKWFSSATDANMCILLARTPDGQISTFYAPMRRTVLGSSPTSPSTELNGVTIQRLKLKLGTRALPTAELELRDMRGYLLGKSGQGIREIAAILNITRIHTAVTAMGLWGRGLAISRAFARVRKISRVPLMDIPAHVSVMAEQEVQYRGLMHLVFFTILLLGICEQRSGDSNLSDEHNMLLPKPSDASLLLRVLTPTIKALAAKASIKGLAECTESLGGVGYLENEDMEFNIARLLRDTCVLSIWEGTTDVMAGDLLKVLKGRQGSDVLMALDGWIGMVGKRGKGWGDRWKILLKKLKSGELEELRIDGREIMQELGWVMVSVLLSVDHERDGDEVAAEVMRRWMGEGKTSSVQERMKWNRRIVFGGMSGEDRTSKL